MIAARLPSPPASGARLTSPVSRALAALATRASVTTCAGVPCALSAAYLADCADAWGRKPEAVREGLSKRFRALDDPRFADLREIYLDAVMVTGGAL